MSQQLLINANNTSLGFGAIFGMLAGFGMVMILLWIALLVLTIIAMWRLFTKAGEEGWKSIIPFYNVYILFKIAGRNFWKYFGIAVLLGIVNGVAESVANSALAMLLALATLALAIWLIVEMVKFYHGLSTKFGHGAGFTVGLIFLNTIFMLILGLGSSEYQGSNN